MGQNFHFVIGLSKV